MRPDEHFIRPIKFSNLIERRPPQVEFNTVNLSKADKRSLAVARAELVLEQIQQKANKEEPPEFHMVDTICKLLLMSPLGTRIALRILRQFAIT